MSHERLKYHHTVAAGAVVTASIIGGVYYAYRAHHRSSLPTEWTQVATLSHIYVYPVKSCAPVVRNQVECSVLGAKDGWLTDRKLMVTDEYFHFVTARSNPELLTVHPTVEGSILSLEHAVTAPIHIDLAEIMANEKSKTGNVWGCQVPVYDCGDQVAEWLNKVLKSNKIYRLVLYASTKSRPLNIPTASVYRFTKNDTGAFQDQVSYNLVNESTVEDLNRRLDEKVTHKNFRPNFVVKGAQQYDEDNWKFVKIGDNIFEVIKPCSRCEMITMDPETGIRNSNNEPMTTLKSYRLTTNPRQRRAVGSIPRLGVHLALRSGPGALVSLGDPVYIA